MDWGVEQGITTATYHILTPYPGTRQYQRLEAEGRILTHDWDLYDTRHVVYQSAKLTAEELVGGYNWAYKAFYSWTNIFKGTQSHDNLKSQLMHFLYTGGWKKLEPMWNLFVRAKGLNVMLPMLEYMLNNIKGNHPVK